MRKTLFGLILAAVFLAGSPLALADLAEAESAYKSKNYPVAIRELNALSNSGNALVQYYIALMFDNGEGLPQNDQRAIEWYLQSAKQGYAPAQSNLGVIYERGVNVELSNIEAEAWYRKAAAQGYAPAQFNLGLMYFVGRGEIKRNYKEAISWYLKAAEQGYAIAQNSIGRMYENGQGVPVSLVQAYKWYSLADKAGNEAAHLGLKAIENKMSAEMMEDARGQIQAWLANRK